VLVCYILYYLLLHYESLRTKAAISAFEATAAGALRAIALAADPEEWKNMIISEARNLLEMRKTESSATHKSLRKAQAKTAQANAKAARLGALVTSLNSRYGRGARAAVDRVEQRRRYDLDQDMATLKVGDEVELFWTTIQLILIGSELRDPSASGEWHTAKIIKVNAAGGGLLFDVQYDDAEESQEKKVRLHSNKGRKWRRRPPAAAAVAAARGGGGVAHLGAESDEQGRLARAAERRPQQPREERVVEGRAVPPARHAARSPEIGRGLGGEMGQFGWGLGG
jgi:hypothetical protein